MWDYEHIGRMIEVVVRTAEEVDHIEVVAAAAVVPTGSADDTVAAGHTVVEEEEEVGSIDSAVVLGLGMVTSARQTLVIVGRESEVLDQVAAAEVYYNLIALAGRVMRVRRMGQEWAVDHKVTVAGPVTQGAKASAAVQAAARFVRTVQVAVQVAAQGTAVAGRHCSRQRMMMLSYQRAA